MAVSSLPNCDSCLRPFTGITRFDLLGDFGRFNWLGNFYIVLSYNLLFAVVTTLCLVRKFTSAVREELLKALGKKNVSPLIFHGSPGLPMHYKEIACYSVMFPASLR